MQHSSISPRRCCVGIRTATMQVDDSPPNDATRLAVKRSADITNTDHSAGNQLKWRRVDIIYHACVICGETDTYKHWYFYGAPQCDRCNNDICAAAREMSY